MPRGCQQEVVGLVKEAMRDAYNAVEGRLLEIADRHAGRSREKVLEFCGYLARNRDGVMDYRRQLGLVEEGHRGLGD